MSQITITSANAKFTLTARNASNGLPIVGPFTVEGYATDASFASEAVDTAETYMGVDGKMSSGLVPAIIPFIVSLMPNSPSVRLMDAILAAQSIIGDVLELEGVVAAPSLGTLYTYYKGVIRRATRMPTGRKTFSEPQTFELNWESVTPAPIS